PPPGHPQMGPEDHSAPEPQNEILADGFHGLQSSPVEPFGHALGLRTRMRRLDGELLADEHLQPPGRAVEGIALRHASERSAHGRSGTLSGLQDDSTVAARLNIAALARRTGVPADTIRKWEQRYGVLQPERTTGGQQRYSE